MFSGSRIAGGGRGRGGLSRPSLVWHPDRRSTPDPDGWLNGSPPLRGGLRTRIEMTGTNYISGAPRFGERQRQLLKKRKAARGHSFPRLTSHANGRLPSGTPPAFFIKANLENSSWLRISICFTDEPHARRLHLFFQSVAQGGGIIARSAFPSSGTASPDRLPFCLR